MGLNRLAHHADWPRIQRANAKPRRNGQPRPRLLTLEEGLALLANFPHAHAFVEIKRAAFRAHGDDGAARLVAPMLDAWRQQVTVISFHAPGLEAIRRLGAWPLGWVFATWGARQRRIAEQLQPQWLFCDMDAIPPDATLWPGPWRWALYETSAPQRAREWLARGAELIECNAITAMLAACDDAPTPGAA
ncbi:putative glycerophosphoryl diester phosphodiesterase [Magnetofaba australis IT-1]|uniref:Putative glycerophosphoryl diester phosphodiesterase n=1 Tax=Magnetofaba australis IT-1 TaxID=1434232 RepID=A0A1Y2K2B0_9PROT|nr:putative glycerophosphoryl diester phosphodiesterase [Magnetofaba australis IT-1]